MSSVVAVTLIRIQLRGTKSDFIDLCELGFAKCSFWSECPLMARVRRRAAGRPMTTFVDTVSKRVTHLTDAEQKALLLVTGQHRAGFRDHVLFALALGAGLREHEIVALNVGDVLFDGRARRRISLSVFKRSSSEPTKQEVMLSDTLRAKLERLVALTYPGERTDSDPLFVSREGNRLSTRQVRNSFCAWQQRAGFERRVHFHALRHTACTNVYAVSKDIRLTQRFARHKSLTTTSIYTHPTDDDLRRAVSAIRC
jgi:site-specific recombinase XerC